MTPFASSLPMQLYRALDSVMPAYRELFSQYELTEQQWRILRVVWLSETVTSADLANQTLLSPPSLVGIIDRLEKKQLVERIRSKDDRRQIYIVVTAAGRQLQQDILPQLEKIQSNLKLRVSAEEWAMLETILEKLSQHPASTPASHDVVDENLHLLRA